MQKFGRRSRPQFRRRKKKDFFDLVSCPGFVA
jgi:hypothetical protein